MLINSLNDVLALTLMDWNEHRKDSELGVANFDLKSLATDPEQESVNVPVMMQGKDRGTVKCGIRFFPTLVPKKLENGTEEPVPESSRLTLQTCVFS